VAGDSDLYSAIAAYESGNDQLATGLTRDALLVFAANGIQPRAACCELLLARLALRAHGNGVARAYCESAIRRLEPIEAPAVACHVHLTLGEAKELSGDVDGARRSYEDASSILELLRDELVQEDSKIAFLKDKIPVYENLVRVTLRDQDSETGKTRAFDYIEKAKSRSLAELVAARSSTSRPADSPLEKIRRLRENITWAAHRLEREQMVQPAGVPERLRPLREEIRQLTQQLADSLSVEANARRASTGELEGILSLQAVREALPSGTTVLEYFECRRSLLACVLDRERLEVADLGPLDRIRDHFRLLQFQFSKFRLGPNYISRFSEQLYPAIEDNLQSLYAELIAPIRHLFHGERLAIVPHAFLHQLPFHALSDGQKVLLEEFEVYYAPSASTLTWLLRKQSPLHSQSLVMGVADPQAPQIEQESQAVASVLPNSQLFLGSSASLENLRAFAGHSRYIHLAAHGYFREENPKFSSIRMGDSMVTLLDLCQLELSAELVTMSGCGTGLNVIVGGDELVGLVRGLFQAGARSMLVSLWDVHDASTTQLMEAFYKNLATMTKCQALRTASLGLRERSPHPYYWAPFVLVGAPC
jgi:hypothetical protein